ncbi:YbjN domain-containing protein [Micromonospora sp. DT233]|uniref:YbjN domain-containing protein n=1 Tax=Micromonospora sp. DT233 TaxID=3393432 RepID=UPI003CFB8296
MPDGPILKLFEELKRLHRTAGEPSMRTIGDKIKYSYATVHSAMRGPKIPRWPPLELIVEELGGDVDHFKQLWIAALDFQESHNPPPSESIPSSINTETPKARQLEIPSLADLPRITIDRIQTTLDDLGVGYQEEDEESVLALWLRHRMLFAVEGPTEEILMMRAQINTTLPIAESARARLAVNEWNHTRRFMKAYVGDPDDENRIHIYGEMQIPLGTGATDQQLAELIDCGAAVGTLLAEWMHDEGCLSSGSDE